MTEASFCASAQPITAFLADMDGTLVTRAKVVTAIEAIEKLHDRQGALRDHRRAAAARHAHGHDRRRQR
jgi:beta-phosphoglucomutase-like phosphatase (HAD superfamily)